MNWVTDCRHNCDSKRTLLFTVWLLLHPLASSVSLMLQLFLSYISVTQQATTMTHALRFIFVTEKILGYSFHIWAWWHFPYFLIQNGLKTPWKAKNSPIHNIAYYLLSYSVLYIYSHWIYFLTLICDLYFCWEEAWCDGKKSYLTWIQKTWIWVLALTSSSSPSSLSSHLNSTLKFIKGN